MMAHPTEFTRTVPGDRADYIQFISDTTSVDLDKLDAKTRIAYEQLRARDTRTITDDLKMQDLEREVTELRARNTELNEKIGRQTTEIRAISSKLGLAKTEKLRADQYSEYLCQAHSYIIYNSRRTNALVEHARDMRAEIKKRGARLSFPNGLEWLESQQHDDSVERAFEKYNSRCAKKKNLDKAEHTRLSIENLVDIFSNMIMTPRS